jgi:hypothetical protein
MMRKLLVAAAIVLAGCRDTASPASTVALSAVTSASSIPVRGSVSITLTIYNRGDEAITVPIADCFVRPFEILDSRGVVVAPLVPEVCALALFAPQVIEAGASFTYTTTWNGEASVGPADEIIYLGPGQYTIRARVLVQENTFVYATPIGLTVTAAQ